jgi:hypothetical protein
MKRTEKAEAILKSIHTIIVATNGKGTLSTEQILERLRVGGYTSKRGLQKLTPYDQVRYAGRLVVAGVAPQAFPKEFKERSDWAAAADQLAAYAAEIGVAERTFLAAFGLVPEIDMSDPKAKTTQRTTPSKRGKKTAAAAAK